MFSHTHSFVFLLLNWIHYFVERWLIWVSYYFRVMRNKYKPVILTHLPQILYLFSYSTEATFFFWNVHQTRIWNGSLALKLSGVAGGFKLWQTSSKCFPFMPGTHCMVLGCPRWNLTNLSDFSVVVAPKSWSYVIHWEKFKDGRCHDLAKDTLRSFSDSFRKHDNLKCVCCYDLANTNTT